MKIISNSILASLEYTHNENQYCSGAYIQTYPSLADAKQACNQNKECGVITDFDCDGDQWATCKGNGVFSSSSGSCSWVKSKYGKIEYLSIQ